MPSEKPDRYAIPQDSQTAFEPGSRNRVLRNRLGIRSTRAMDRAEYEALLRVQQVYAHKEGLADHRFSAEDLRQMQRDWLASIYPWAGEFRVVNVSKAGFAWPPAYLVPDLMKSFESEVLAKNTPCSGSSIAEISLRVAEVHGELLLIHPFREGNGRLARWLAEIMGQQAGLPTADYRFRGRGSAEQRRRYLHGVKRAYLRDYAPLAAFFEEAFRAGLGEFKTR